VLSTGVNITETANYHCCNMYLVVNIGITTLIL